MVAIHLSERVVQGAACAFGGVTSAPTVASEGPAQLKTRPARRIQEANPSHEVASLLFFDSPNAITTKIPMAHERGHLSPRFHIGHRFSITKETRDFRIAADAREFLEIIFAEP